MVDHGQTMVDHGQSWLILYDHGLTWSNMWLFIVDYGSSWSAIKYYQLPW
jgi:hypothetical protein